jgi:tRNA pseudouridine38-40 synthase
LFGLFIGTKKYHNLAKDIRPHQTAALRYMKRLKADTFMYINKDTLDVTDKDDPNSIEFIHFFLKGQAFLYNQIRKMVGLIIQVFRGNLEDEFIANAFTDNFVNVCLAPGDGLLLEQVCYDNYNNYNDHKKSEIMLRHVT